MIEKLKAYYDRYQEILQECCKPEVISDIQKWQKLSKEQSDLEEYANLYERYETLTRNIENAKEVLAPIIEKIIQTRDSKSEEIKKRWPEISGPRISQYSSFLRIEKKTLFIAADDTRYIPLILAQKKRIIDKYNSFFPSDDIKYIKVIVESY